MRNTIVTVGTFDGLHLGHKAVIQTLQLEAEKRALEPIIITFDNHPLDVVAPDRAPKLLMTPQEKRSALHELPVKSVVLKFDKQLCALTARQWLERMRREYSANAIVVGYDNTFGCDGRHLSREQLHDIATEVGLEWINPPVLEGISSSIVRHTLERGDIETANKMLGCNYQLRGVVVDGKKLGRTLGFPTANISVETVKLLPQTGVYAAIATIESQECFKAVVNIGTRPSVDDGSKISVEAYLIDFSGNLYDRQLSLSFTKRIRGEHKFDSLDELKQAIADDVEFARNVIND